MIPLVSECMIFGTTDDIITSVISSPHPIYIQPLSQRNTPYSSEVLMSELSY